jgi:integrase
VDDETLTGTVKHLSPTVVDMLEVQRLTGMRPGELCGMRPGDIDRAGDVWIFRPGSHKMEHKGRLRAVETFHVAGAMSGWPIAAQ